jgi:hypothetical protein
MKGVGQMKTYRRFSKEFNRSLLARIDNGIMSKTADAREHEIYPSLLTREQQLIHEGSIQARLTASDVDGHI